MTDPHREAFLVSWTFWQQTPSRDEE